MFCWLGSGSSCRHGLRGETGSKGRAGGHWAHREQSREVQSWVVAVQQWSRGDAGCGAGVGENSVCCGKSSGHVGSATSALLHCAL